MTLIRYIALGVAVVLSVVQSGESQTTQNHSDAKEQYMSTASKFFSKGGIGIIAKDNLWVDVKSDSNELIYGTGRDRWRGLAAPGTELIIFFEGKIWSMENVPDRFDLSKSVIVSFETDKVRFFDFRGMSGGYYERITK